MGTDKALLEVDGQPMAARAADVLVDAGAREVFCVGGDRERLARLGLDVRPDRHPGEGPLGGLVTAFAETEQPVVVALACDLLRPASASVAAVLTALQGDPAVDGAVPILEGRRQWLHAAYRRRSVDPLTRAFSAGERSIERASADLVLVEVSDVDPETLRDADMPNDLDGSPGTMPPPS